MNRVSIRLLSFAATFALGVSASLSLMVLRSGSGNIPSLNLADEAPSTILTMWPESSNSPIRNIDFANFTYPAHVVGHAGSFKLRHGELPPKRKDSIGRPLDMWLSLGDVTYGDVTGDGSEEAIIDIGWITGGTASPGFVYIYGLRKGKPTPLWAFETGDRAEGGYKNVFSEDGKLVVELLGKDKIIGTDLYKNDGTFTGLCCPAYFTRTKYEWSNNRFKQHGKAEVLPLDR